MGERILNDSLSVLNFIGVLLIFSTTIGIQLHCVILMYFCVHILSNQ